MRFNILLSFAFLLSFSSLATTQSELLSSLYLNQYIDEDLKETASDWMLTLNDVEVSREFLLSLEKEQTGFTGFQARKHLIEAFSHSKVGGNILANDDIAHQLQVFKAPTSAHLFESLFPTSTLYLGETYGAFMLISGATNDVNLLEKRQETVKTLLTNSALRTKILTLSRSMQTHENRMLEMIASHTPQQETPISKAPSWHNETYVEFVKQEASFWPLLKKPWKVPWMVFQATLPVSVAYLTYLTNQVLWSNTACGCSKWCCGKTILTALEASAILDQGAEAYYTHYENQETNRALTEKLRGLHTLIMGLQEFSGPEIPEVLRTTIDPNYTSVVDEIGAIISSLDDNEEGHFYQINLLRAQSALELVQHAAPAFNHLLEQLGRLDFYASVAEGILGSPDLFSFVEFVASKEPYLEILEVKNPILGPTSVPNSLILGGENVRNVLLTGPNASGKSTLMRAVGINIYHLAQTLGISTSKKMRLAPFDQIQVFMENRDALGTKSSYEGEVDKIVGALEGHQHVSKFGERGFLLVDEILSSTNAQDAIDGSKLLIERFIALPQTNCIISTHLDPLTALGDEYPDLIENMHMEIIRRARNDYDLTFQLAPGRNLEQNGLELIEDSFGEFLGRQS